MPTYAKHPIILPSRHALTRLVVLYEHSDAGHAGPSYTLMKTRQRFWIIHGISRVKRYLVDCAKCARKKAKPIRQLMVDLPSFRVTAVNKPFKFCGTDYIGPCRRCRRFVQTGGLPVGSDSPLLQHNLLLRFEPRYLCSVFNTFIYLICILLLCCASFIIRSKETLQSCLKDAPFCRLLITFLATF